MCVCLASLQLSFDVLSFPVGCHSSCLFFIAVVQLLIKVLISTSSVLQLFVLQTKALHSYHESFTACFFVRMLKIPCIRSHVVQGPCFTLVSLLSFALAFDLKTHPRPTRWATVSLQCIEQRFADFLCFSHKLKPFLAAALWEWPCCPQQQQFTQKELSSALYHILYFLHLATSSKYNCLAKSCVQ